MTPDRPSPAGVVGLPFDGVDASIRSLIESAPPHPDRTTVVAAANTPLRKTGNWRVWRPVIDLTHCSQCWMCFVSCPDGAIALDHDDNPHIDYDVCKGCLICVEECPTHAISKILEAVA